MNGRTETLSILPACVPALPAGEYALHVEQVVKGVLKRDGPSQQSDVKYSKSSQTFHVSGPRFSLDASLVYSVYPPREANAYFSDCLPHVVLTRRTLPWEREIDVNGSNTDPAKDVPWLALLLLDADDLNVDGENRRSAKAALRNELELPRELGEKDDEPCKILRLPLELFCKIAPSREDLPYLAHVRRVEQGDMAADGVRDAGWFSVIVCNRVPVAGKAHEVFLISLEGLWPYLPTDRGTPQNAAVKEVSIIVLASWQFTNNGTKKGFSEIVTNLREPAERYGTQPQGGGIAPLKLGIRLGQGKTIEPSERKEREKNGHAGVLTPDDVANGIIDAGYVPLAHTTRRGDRIVSWYRGPLVPLFVPTQQLVSFSCADAALRYDAHLGLFDVSYAAAWQLGRLLALQNQQVVRALRSLALRERLEAQQKQAREEFLARFGADSRQVATFEDAVAQLLAGSTAPRDTAGTDAGSAMAAKDSEVSPSEITQIVADEDASRTAPSGTAASLAEITQWLGRLSVLHGVPFSYLLAKPALLEAESIRLFYLDSAWIAALLDGALSLARSGMTPFLLQRAMAGEYLQVQSLPDDAPEKTLGKPSMIRHLTGFLIRSELISGWRGVKIVAYSTSGARLEVLRMERLVDDVLLCIYNGKLGRIELTEPPHAVHFGIGDNDQPKPRESAKALAIAKFAGSMAVTQFVDRMLAKPKHVVLKIQH